MQLAAARCSFDFVAHPHLREVVFHWASLVRRGEAPDRRALDPGEIRNALPFVWLCQNEAPGSWRVRLAGAQVNALLQQPLRGRLLHEVLDASAWHELHAKLEEVVGVPAVLWSEGPIFETDPDGALGECIMMPLQDRGRLTVVLGATAHGLSHVRAPARLLASVPKSIRSVPVADL